MCLLLVLAILRARDKRKIGFGAIVISIFDTDSWKFSSAEPFSYNLTEMSNYVAAGIYGDPYRTDYARERIRYQITAIGIP